MINFQARALQFYALATLVLILDQLTKLWVRTNLPIGEGPSILGDVIRLSHVQNYKGAFGLPAPTLVFIIAAFLAILIFILYGVKLSQDNRQLGVSLALAFGGTVGNLVDRILFKSVTDFIDIGIPNTWRWPTFNIADTALTIGAFLLAWHLFRSPPNKPE